ncbi:MAG: hypothetical protein CL864_02690, partial [Cyanobium sp. SAT1300]|nr:hypothetical protein [Cyanobium sp. SAT1300]
IVNQTASEQYVSTETFNDAWLAQKLTKLLRKRLVLTKYQFMWLSFVKGLVIGCLLTLAFSS